MLYCLLLPPASKASQGSARRIFKTRALVNGESGSRRSIRALTEARRDVDRLWRTRQDNRHTSAERRDH
jgi:hypothetical protein